jgi:hypothetical protein
MGFWKTLTNLPETWTGMARGMSEGISGLPPICEDPSSNVRLWAEAANNRIIYRLDKSNGPFWGPNFSRPTDPLFFHPGGLPFEEYRLVEKRLPGCKPVFKIGGHGSVGLQSLCGIPLLFHLRTECLKQNIPLHFWPFDGWHCNRGHVVVEWYPSIYNKGQKSDENDARACVEWARLMDVNGILSSYFTPQITNIERTQANFEGWVLGVL